MRQRMYIGPTIPGIVKANTIYVGELPDKLDKLIEELPIVNNLVVPIDALTKAKKALSELGSVENVAYKQVMTYRKKER